jgi:hypothetical protein
VQWKRPWQTWAQASDASQAYQVTPTYTGPEIDNFTIYIFDDLHVAFDVRVRQTGIIDYDYHELSYDPGDEPSSGAISARTTTYKSVRDGLAKRLRFSEALSTLEAAEIAEYLTSAYRYVLEAWPWAELTRSEEVTVTDGLVTWAAVWNGDFREFWTENPDAPDSKAKRVTVVREDASGLRLNVKAATTTVWARFTPRPPEFTSSAYNNAKAYVVGDLVYDDTTGHCYECTAAGTGNAVTNTAHWRALPILLKLAEVTKLLALAEWIGAKEERGQAESIQANAERKLDQLTKREPQPR